MVLARNQSLYEINTRVWLKELARKLGRAATLDDIPDATLNHLRDLGFDWVWLLGVWQIGPAGRHVSLTQPQWREEYAQVLGDFTDDDACGSPFAVQSYTTDRTLGGPAALAAIRKRLAARGLKLMLDFVPNHTALDHAWVKDHPEYYIQGDEGDLQREPQNYIRLETHHGPLVFAHGRDPYFPGWPDTLQLNHRHAELREVRRAELLQVAAQCDGLRCDMAMLLLPDVIQRSWGDKSLPNDHTAPVDTPFWPEAIAAVRKQAPDFLFLAEVYWDLEWTLQQVGFDSTYDKRLYDRLHAQDAGAVRGHLHADLAFQEHSARFLENHDEPRAAGAFPLDVHRAAAAIAFLVPGLRFFHEGQLRGRRVKVPMHLNRRPNETPDAALVAFYERLLECLRCPAARTGCWQLLDCRAAWAGSTTAERFIAFLWEAPGEESLLVAVNYGRTPGQCYVQLPFHWLKDRQYLLRDLLSAARYQRDGNQLRTGGLYLDLGAWGHHVFEMIVE